MSSNSKKFHNSSSKSRQSTTATKASGINGVLSVSPVKATNSSRGSTSSSLQSRKTSKKTANPNLSASISKRKPPKKQKAWALKEDIDETPRSEVSVQSSDFLSKRPSLDDFLDGFDDHSATTLQNDEVQQSLLEYLSADTVRSSIASDIDFRDPISSTERSDTTVDNNHECKSRAVYDTIKTVNSLDSSDNLRKKRSPSKSSSSSVKSWSSKNSQESKNKKNITKSKPNNNESGFMRGAVFQQDKVHSNQLSSAHQVSSSKFSKETAAKYIQLWWRKIHIRNQAGRAAMERMMENKRRQLEEQAKEKRKDYSRQLQEFEEVRKREEKTRETRQKIIDEMYEKRTGSQKTLKTQGKTNKSKKVSSTKKTTKSNNHLITDDDERQPNDKRLDTASSVGKKIDELFESSSRGSDSPRSTIVSEQKSSFTTSSFTAISPSHLTEEDSDMSTIVGHNVKESKTSLDDLLNTLKELEDEPIDLYKQHARVATSSVTADESPVRSSFQRSNHFQPQSEEKPGSLLSADKLKTIMSFLDEVEKVEDDVRSEVLSQSTVFQPTEQAFEKSMNTVESMAFDNASQVASDISNAITAQRIEIDEKSRTVEMMQKAMGQQKEFTTMQLREMDKEHKKQLSLQRQEYEGTIKRHLSFIDQLIDDKKVLTERCEDLVNKLKDIDQKFSTKIKQLADKHSMELKKQKEVSEAAEKLRREKWIKEKTQEIKEITVKGLEPDIQKLIAKHKAEIKKIKAMKQGEVLEADERVGRKYVQQIEDLRMQLEKEKEMAVKKERENARMKFEDQLRDEESSYQQQRRRLYTEIEQEKERINEQTIIMRKEFDEQRIAYENSARQTLTSTIQDHERLINETKRNHEDEMRQHKEKLDVEKQQWIENYMKKQETHLLAKERELKESVRDNRDKEIEMVIARLEQESATSREESERAAENRIKRIRDKYNNELKEMETSERTLHDKCLALKERCEDLENVSIQTRSDVKQKEQELIDVKKITDRLQEERGKVSDIIRQEFSDRLVALEDESKRLRSELHEEKSRHRFDVERITKDKEDEMDEVHQRVKKAISKKEETTKLLRQQMIAAEKRAEHLEQLLAEQRKKILSK